MGRDKPPKQTSAMSLAERQQARMMAMAGQNPMKKVSSNPNFTSDPPVRSSSPTLPNTSLNNHRAASPTPQSGTSPPNPTSLRPQTASPIPSISGKTSPIPSGKVSPSPSISVSKSTSQAQIDSKHPKKKEKEKKGLFGRIAQAVTGDSDDDEEEEDDGEDMQAEIDRIMRGPKPGSSTSQGAPKGLSLAERAALAHSRAAGRH